MKLTFNLDEKNLKTLLERALRSWGVTPEYVRLSFDKTTQQPSGTVGYTVRGNRESFSLTGDVIIAGVLQASAAAGNPLDPASLQFVYNEGRGYGGSASVSATAKEGTFEPDQTATQPGKVKFPGTVTKQLGIDELKKVVQRGAERAGHKVTWISFSHSNGGGPASASLSITKNGNSGTISLDPAELEAEIIEELGHQGYDAQPGIEYYTSGSGFGSRGGTSATVKLTGMPK
jgi:hypothetical protein